MYNIKIDPITYTLLDIDAYSTILENIREAEIKALSSVGIAVHDESYLRGNANMGGLSRFNGLLSLNNKIENIKFYKVLSATIKGINRMDIDVSVDLINSSDYSLISYNKKSMLGISPTLEGLTNTFLLIINNSNILAIDSLYEKDVEVDLEKVVAAAKLKNKAIVFLNRTLDLSDSTIYKKAYRLAELCKKYNCPIMVASGAKFSTEVGIFDNIYSIFNDVNIPENLIVNKNESTFNEYLSNFKK